MSDNTAAARWTVPALDGSEGKGYLTAGRLQELQKEAYEEAWKKGHAEGLQAGEGEIAERAARYDDLLRALCLPFDQLDEQIEKQLLELSVALVKQLFRREIKINPDHVVGAVREAIQTLPIASRSVRVCLHPEDAALVRSSLTPADGDPAWRLVEDPLIERGGCLVTTENSQIDATAEARLHAVIGRCLGEDRQT